MKLLITAATAVLVGAGVAAAAPAQAYPNCYYNYYGCYLGPGWYDGYWWAGGPWWGRGGYGPSMPVMGCPVPYETGGCG